VEKLFSECSDVSSTDDTEIIKVCCHKDATKKKGKNRKKFHATSEVPKLKSI